MAGIVFTTGQALPITIAAIALSILPIIIEARDVLDPDEDEFTPVRNVLDCISKHSRNVFQSNRDSFCKPLLCLSTTC